MTFAFRSRRMCALLLALAAAPALAQSADRPELRPGDQWQFAHYWSVRSTETNRLWRIQSVGPSRIEATENGEPLTLTPSLGVLDSPRDSDSNPNPLSFPLEVGKRWSYTTQWLFKAKGSKGTADVAVHVAAFEKVALHAGEFDAFRLEAHWVLKGIAGIGSRIDAENRVTFWYAPAARAVVKSVNRNPYLGTSTVELVKYEPAH